MRLLRSRPSNAADEKSTPRRSRPSTSAGRTTAPLRLGRRSPSSEPGSTARRTLGRSRVTSTAAVTMIKHTANAAAARGPGTAAIPSTATATAVTIVAIRRVVVAPATASMNATPIIPRTGASHGDRYQAASPGADRSVLSARVSGEEPPSLALADGSVGWSGTCVHSHGSRRGLSVLVPLDEWGDFCRSAGRIRQAAAAAIALFASHHLAANMRRSARIARALPGLLVVVLVGLSDLPDRVPPGPGPRDTARTRWCPAERCWVVPNRKGRCPNCGGELTDGESVRG
jgi:hypothetical protein